MKPDKVHDWFNPAPAVPEINDGKEVVEKEGYIPADVQINMLLEAGERLGAARKEQFDYDTDEVPQEAIDGHALAMADPVDASRAIQQVGAVMTARISAVQKNRAEKEKAEEGKDVVA